MQVTATCALDNELFLPSQVFFMYFSATGKMDQNTPGVNLSRLSLYFLSQLKLNCFLFIMLVLLFPVNLQMFILHTN